MVGFDIHEHTHNAVGVLVVGIETRVVPEEGKYEYTTAHTQPQPQDVEQGVVAVFEEFAQGDGEIVLDHSGA